LSNSQHIAPLDVEATLMEAETPIDVDNPSHTDTQQEFPSEKSLLKASLVHRLRHIRHPRLRLYQQIVICFVAMVLIPLLGVSFIIHSINQKALKKEIAKFTEHTADALYKDLQRDMQWQKDLMTSANATYLRFRQQPGSTPKEALQSMFPSIQRLEQAGLYSSQGQLLHTLKQKGSTAPLLPKVLAIKPSIHPVYTLVRSTGPPATQSQKHGTTYWLRGCLPNIEKNTLPHTGSILCLQVPFDAFNPLIASEETGVFQSVYLVNAQGEVVATSEQQTLFPHLLPKTQLERFKTLAPGILKQTEVPSNQALQFRPLQVLEGTLKKPLKSEEDLDNIKPIRAIMVKIPDIHWGIVIESPYEIKQHYIRRARDQSLLLILGSLIVVILLVLVYVLGISRNFRQLIKGTQAMAAGNYKRRIRLITHAWTPYEILYLTLEFNRMARKTAEAWEDNQRLTQQLSKLDELKSNLIDTVSHELRTPLTSIKGYTSRLLRYDTTLDPEIRRQSLKAVKAQADRLTRLVDDLLVIPDLENAALRVYPDTVLLRPLVERCMELIHQKEGSREFILKPYLKSSTGKNWETVQVFVDPDRFEQILLNLLDNALKYSIPNTPISVEVIADVPTHKMLMLNVSNMSDPIAPDVLPTLVEKFKRLDDQLTRTTRGTGLGLFIAKQLAEAMGGDLVLDYEPTTPYGLFTASICVPMDMPAETPDSLGPVSSHAILS
jgi:signal transduction histidine kinase